ncbi:MAG: hypothetical protein CL693_06555 [Cellvibrionaceae bacterium]|nr:hypothetical protein [Cellvibrionaceae bacterium]|tara:strand:- start:191 stop:451 length:261 start_codon:yes stop_codon:yes gene_type:complete
MTALWIVAAITLAVLGTRLIAQNFSQNTAPNESNLFRNLGLGLWVISLLSTHAIMPWAQAVFTWLGLLSLVGIGWVFLHPKRRRTE